MNVFNPKILDASIRDVTAGLSDEQKADVLLHAMGHLTLERSRSLIENAVQSVLLIHRLSPATAAKARLMRGKARLAAGLTAGAHKDLLAVLAHEPDNPEAKSLMVQVGSQGKSAAPHHTSAPGFSTEIWREIALWLPSRDLKTLLSVPHPLSRIASELLFQKIDLKFASDKQESQRSADILTQFITDENFAKHVKLLRVFVPGRDAFPMTFQTGMLANAMPKLKHLKNVHCSMRWKDMHSFLKILESVNPRLNGLSLMPSDGSGELRFPRFKHLTQFSYVSNGGSSQQLDEFLIQNRATLRFIRLHNLNWTFPTEVISIKNLTHLDFLGLFPHESRAFAAILANGHQLESLRLQVVLECNASAQFREHVKALPFLRHFSFSLLGYRVNDHDLFPAVSAFLRGRTALRTLQLTVPSADWAQKRLGYDATVWGVLPSLTNLTSLMATLPKDVAPAVAMWLVPRGVRALSLQAANSTDPIEFVTQLRPGLPPSLRYVGLSQFLISDVVAVVEHGFPMVQIVRIDEDYYTVFWTDGKVQVVEWPKGRTVYHAREWLQSFGCEDAEWRGPAEFL
ncbi:hypothetical protein OBBRIDRAFT_839982 [Obba rivulosa]|uniref:Uncharacterized protein n=1 Tax=Obba rivulosa TaxID=1052685 RepID=A0A8E2ALK1_9APHY|nr:hypothetical protein OBBRIDRAFT_839982 [Obba rivulosa]